MKQDEANLIAIKNSPIKTSLEATSQASIGLVSGGVVGGVNNTIINTNNNTTTSTIIAASNVNTAAELKMLEDEKQMVGGCCVCADDSGYSDNQLVYCDGHECLVAVHQGCYGIITVPEGNWYCKVCEFKLTAAKESSTEKIVRMIFFLIKIIFLL